MRDPAPDIVEIHYMRPPGRVTIFRQQVVVRRDDCIVTLLEHADVRAPVMVRDRVVLEPGAPVVWFTFPDAWHDIGRFHTAAGEFTGYYANVLSPVRFISPAHWETTDLFLDVWLDEDGPVLLDEDELADALRAGHVGAETADRARTEAASLCDAARAGAWPPQVCREWTLDRVRAGGTHGTQDGAVV